MASAGPPLDIQIVIAKVKTLINAQLKNILKRENLPVSGVKSAMQTRIIEHIEKCVRSGNTEAYNRVKNLISPSSGGVAPPSSHIRPQYPTPPFPRFQPQSQTQTTIGTGANSASRAAMPPNPYSTGRLTFKNSPFYNILEPLTSTVECKVRENSRDHVELIVNLTPAVAARLQNDSNIRAMVYCTGESGQSLTNSEIAFPHQVELKVNLDEVKSNLRGLKNKPGSTRPADITTFIRKKPGYPNKVDMTFALTTKTQKFYVLVNLVQRIPVDNLVARLKAGRNITKDQVIREMRSKAQDTDIVATSTVMSLKCPLSTLRIEVPCRSMVCTHNQCFDASSFLQLQEQAPTWTCPVCNKRTEFATLQVDQYVNEILQACPPAVEQVTIEPGGNWSKNVASETSHQNSGVASPADEDDDLVEIQDIRVASLKQESLPSNGAMNRTPPISSREQSIASSGPRTSGIKRPASQVIDLTGSDDDEEPPYRPIKRPSYTPNGSFRRNGSTNGVSFGVLNRPKASQPPGPYYDYDAPY